MPAIYPFLWFDRNAEEAANFYVSIFPNSRIKQVTHYTAAGPLPEGTVLTVDFELDGKPVVALNGGPEFKFTEAISLTVECKDQAEIDRYWAALTAGGGAEVQCGWLKDKYGLSWQVVPAGFGRLIADDDKARAQRVMQAMFAMKKLDIAQLEAAASA